MKKNSIDRQHLCTVTVIDLRQKRENQRRRKSPGSIKLEEVHEEAESVEKDAPPVSRGVIRLWWRRQRRKSSLTTVFSRGFSKFKWKTRRRRRVYAKSDSMKFWWKSGALGKVYPVESDANFMQRIKKRKGYPAVRWWIIEGWRICEVVKENRCLVLGNWISDV